MYFLKDNYQVKLLFTGQKVSHSTINKIIKKELGFKFFKVSPKTNKLLSNQILLIINIEWKKMILFIMS